MFDEYSIEQRAKLIPNKNTKGYFAEVVSCYNSGNYRSAVVMLWSVAVCDLLFKLNELAERYDDTKAKKILAEIKSQQENNKRSPKWEEELINKISERTELLNTSEETNLRHLQEQRHLSAHPVVNEDFQLHRPNQETVRALIRNTLDGLLIKDPLLSRSQKIASDLVDDIRKNKELFPSIEKLTTYLDSKYYSRLSMEAEKGVFRSLWKFVFRSEDDNCEENREINYKALFILYNKKRTEFNRQIETDKTYFSNTASADNILFLLIKFLSFYPEVYNLLTEDAKTLIEGFVEKDVTSRWLAWFTANSLEEHINNLRRWIDDKPNYDKFPDDTASFWDDFVHISQSDEWKRAVIYLAIKCYGASYSFDIADERFEKIILRILQDTELEDLELLIEESQENSQIYKRRKASSASEYIYNRILEINPQYNLPNEYEYLRKL